MLAKVKNCIFPYLLVFFRQTARKCWFYAKYVIKMKLSTEYNRFIVFILVAIFLSSSGSKEEQSKKPVLIYIYDPLCGWCYAFSPVITEIKKEFEGKLDIQIVIGGLVTGERVGPVKEIYGDYLEEALSLVERRSDVRFGNDFKELMREGNYIYNSEPPAVALTIVKETKPDIAFDYGLRLYQVLFAEGKSLNDLSTYLNLADEFNLDKNSFERKLSDSVYIQKARAEFAKADSLGAVGYPTLLLKKEKEIKVITDGFVDYKSIRKKLEKEIKKI